MGEERKCLRLVTELWSEGCDARGVYIEEMVTEGQSLVGAHNNGLVWLKPR